MTKVRTYPTTVKVSKITSTVKTRSHLDDDRLEFFQGICSKGGNLGALLLEEMADGNFRVVGGNHRLQVYKNNGATEVPADVIDEVLSPLELYRLAIADNSGGSQPFTKEDLRHQIRILLAGGACTKDIIASFPSIPAEFVMDTAGTVRAMQAKAKAVQALALIIHKGYTLSAACTATGAQPEAVKRLMETPDEKPNATLDVPIRMGVDGVAFRATSRRLSAWYEAAEALYNEQGFGKKEMLQILAHQRQLLKNALNAVEERKERVAKLA